MQLPVVSVLTEMAVELVCRVAERLLESLHGRRGKRGRRLAVRVSGVGPVPAVVVVLVVVDGAVEQLGVSR
jgi:hypothetical protein